MTPAGVAVDVVVLSLSGEPERLCTLLVRRHEPPFQGTWSLPGGRIEAREDLAQAAERMLHKTGGLRHVRHLEQLATFGHPLRDPRGRVVSVSYLALLPRPAPAASGTSWRAVADLPPLAFDHAEILGTAVERLRAKLTYSNVAYGLLPEVFTLRELQERYEAVLGRPLDKRNFRKKVLSLGLLAEAAGQRRGSHRPAQLYRFSRDELVLLDDVIAT